jgi:hypothetical protein
MNRTYSYHHGSDRPDIARLMERQISEYGLEIVPAHDCLRLEISLLA